MLDAVTRTPDLTGGDAVRAADADRFYAIVPPQAFIGGGQWHIVDEFGELESPRELQILRAFVENSATGGIGSPSVLRPFVGERVWVYTDPSGPEPLDQIIRQLREQIDLPADDVARLCGVRRRQFYNLLDGSTSTSASREAHIRLVHQLVHELWAACEHDRGQLRSALLMPVGPSYETFLDVAAGQDPDTLRAVVSELVERLRSGDVAGMFPRPSPTFQGGSGIAGQALEAMRERGSASRDDVR